METKIIVNFESRLHHCSHCNEPQLSELDLKNHMLSCVKEEENINQPNDMADNLPSSNVTKFGEKHFKCDTCTQSFTSRPNAVSHFNRVHLGIVNSVKCNLCDKELSSSVKLKAHMHRMHKEREKIECNLCGKYFPELDYLKIHKVRVHLENGTSETFECDICNKTFRSELYLKQHTTRNHDKTNKYKCSDCDKTFCSKLRRDTHKNAIHNGIRNLESCRICKKEVCSSYLQKHIAAVHLTKKEFKCDLCPSTFAQNSNLKTHIDATHFGVESSRKKPISSKQFPCTLCSKSFTAKSSQKLHFDSIHLLKKYSCNDCEKLFPSAAKVKMHAKNMHSIGDNFACDLCEKVFSYKGQLKNHQKSVHFKKAPVQCGVCGTLISKTNFQRHMNTAHIDEGKKEEIVKCEFCDRTFKKSSNTILRHIKEEHQEAKEKFICDTCDKEFTTREYFRNHLKIHQNKSFLCEICEKSFTTIGYLKNHKNIVHSEHSMVYECSTCQKTFKHKDTLTQHERIHMSEKQKCSQCDSVLSC